MIDVVAVIMAGGKGERLMPLTKNRAKPAIPFGGIYILLDLTLSNCINSGIYKIVVLPQYKSQSLMEHLEAGWNIFSLDLGHYLRVVPPQMMVGEEWYQGTADSIRQNVYFLERNRSDLTIILSGDHVYKMNYAGFRKYHDEKQADMTISVIEVDRETASGFGVIGVDDDYRVKEFVEKPKDPPSIPGDEEHALASMGIYIFKTDILLDILKHSDHVDFGKEIIPEMIHNHRVYAYPYRKMNAIDDLIYVTRHDGRRETRREKRVRDSGYWRDVGTLDSYWNANMDLTGVDPYFNLYGRKWPIRTYQRQYPPVKTVFEHEHSEQPRVGKAVDSIIAHGCIVSGATVRHCVVSYNVIFESYSLVEESVIMENVRIGRNCKIRKAIIDEGCYIPDGTVIGYDPFQDRKHYTQTNRGIVVVNQDNFPGYLY
ncbi:MAG: glucose-1-phosphate adenylyltransferase [Deltaproteobacteria bacterium]|nr:glucose-1-phosphate adenylyltransferase [Deltaproteobacteria bacterium]